MKRDDSMLRTKNPAGHRSGLVLLSLGLLALTLLAFSLLLLQIPGATAAQTIHVDASAASGGDGSASQPYGSIQDGVNGAAAGDTVQVAAGDYNESVVLDRSLTLQGAGREETLLSAEGMGTSILVEAGDVKITGLGIVRSYAEGYGIRVEADRCLISDVVVMAAGRGVEFNGSANSFLEDSEVQSSIWGVYLTESTGTRIQELTTTSCYYGLWLDPKSQSNTVSNCNVSGNSIGIEVEGTDNIIENSLVSNSDICIYLDKTEGTKLVNNTCQGFGSTGIVLFNSSHNILERNLCDNPGYQGIYFATAIRLTGSPYNELRNNTFTDCSYFGGAISDSPGLVITGNTISNISYIGFSMTNSGDSLLVENNFHNASYSGLGLTNCNNTTLRENLFDGPGRNGLTMSACLNNSLTKNIFLGKGIDVAGPKEEYWSSHVISLDNTVDGLPLLYLVSPEEQVLDLGVVGQAILVSGDGILIESPEFRNITTGILMGFCQNITIRNGSFVNLSWAGLDFSVSGNSSIENCSFSGSTIGIYLSESQNMNIQNCHFQESNVGIYSFFSTQGSRVFGCSFLNHSGYSIQITGNTAPRLEAHHNWWGDESGPSNGGWNPNGKGGHIDNYIAFAPWLRADPKAPQILGIYPIVLENDRYMVQFETVNVNEDSLQWSVHSEADFLVFYPGNQTLVGTLKVAGEFPVSVRAKNSSHELWYNYTLVVFNRNDAPVITVNPLPEGPVNGTITITGTVHDEDETGEIYIQYSKNGQYYHGRIYPDQYGNWSYNFTSEKEQDGEFSLSFRTRDSIGTYSNEAFLNFTIHNPFPETSEENELDWGNFLLVLLLVVVPMLAFGIYLLRNAAAFSSEKESWFLQNRMDKKNFRRRDRVALGPWRKQPGNEEKPGEGDEEKNSKSQEEEAGGQEQEEKSPETEPEEKSKGKEEEPKEKSSLREDTGEETKALNDSAREKAEDRDEPEAENASPGKEPEKETRGEKEQELAEKGSETEPKDREPEPAPKPETEDLEKKTDPAPKSMLTLDDLISR